MQVSRHVGKPGCRAVFPWEDGRVSVTGFWRPSSAPACSFSVFLKKELEKSIFENNIIIAVSGAAASRASRRLPRPGRNRDPSKKDIIPERLFK